MARHPIGCYTPTVKFYSIQLRTGSIVSSNYVVLHLLEVKIYRSGRSKLPPWGKIGTIHVAVQSLLLHINFSPIWYETGQWRKVIRVSCKSWPFAGYLNTSWRSVLDFERRQLRLPIILLNDIDIQLLHGKGIKRRLLVCLSDWNSRGMCLVLVWEIIEANRYENLYHFPGNLGGHRPPRRIRAYQSRTNHELDITSPVPPQNMYLVMFYW